MKRNEFEKNSRCNNFQYIVLVIVTAVIWTYLIASYVPDLGTSNVIEVSTDESMSNASGDNQLAKLSFGSDAENLSWSSVEINLM